MSVQKWAVGDKTESEQLTAALPNTLFYLNHRLSVKNPEPTEFYYSMQRLSSVVLTGIALILYIIALRQIE